MSARVAVAKAAPVALASIVVACGARTIGADVGDAALGSGGSAAADTIASASSAASTGGGPNLCDTLDGGVLLVTTDRTLHSFSFSGGYPEIAKLPADPPGEVVAMALSPHGDVYLELDDRRLYSVDVAAASLTPIQLTGAGEVFENQPFGMAFAADDTTHATSLYSLTDYVGNLARIDLSSASLLPLAPCAMTVFSTRLAGGADGNLYGVDVDAVCPECTTGRILRISPQGCTAQTIGSVPASNLTHWSIAAAKVGFMIFTADATGTLMSSFDPATGATTPVYPFSDEIAAAASCLQL